MKKILLLPILLAGCAAAAVDDVVVVEGPDGAVIENTSGLEERLPDTCMLSNYEGFVGQPIAATILPDDVTTRVVQPGMILSQIYVADRVNFYVDADGIITQITCG